MAPEDKKRVFESLRRQRKSMSIPCDMCQKIVTKGYLATHMKITHGEGWAGRTQYEPTECDKCEKTFGSKQVGFWINSQKYSRNGLDWIFKKNHFR